MTSDAAMDNAATSLTVFRFACILAFSFAPLGCSSHSIPVDPPEARGQWFGCPGAPGGPGAPHETALSALQTSGARFHFVAAHRGDTGHAPGNTVLAISRAVQRNLPLIEIDLRVTTDGALFLFHDHTLNAGNASAPEEWFGRNIESFSAIELERIRLAGNARLPVPHFKDALRAILKSRASMFLIDLKAPLPRHAEVIGRMLAEAEAVGARDRLILQCQGLEELRAARRAYPSLPLLARIGALSEIQPALAADPLILQGDAEWISGEGAEVLRLARKPLLLKTLDPALDNPEGWMKSLGAGASILLTDHASAMQAWGCGGPPL